MSNLFFWLIVYGKIVNILTTLFFILLLVDLTVITCYLTFICLQDYNKNRYSYNGDGEKDAEFYKKLSSKLLKPMIILTSCFILSILLLCIKPDKKEIIGYYVFKEVDRYNSQNIDSNLDPQNFIKNIDETINKINKLTDKMFDKLEDKKENKSE